MYWIMKDSLTQASVLSFVVNSAIKYNKAYFLLSLFWMVTCYLRQVINPNFQSKMYFDFQSKMVNSPFFWPIFNLSFTGSK